MKKIFLFFAFILLPLMTIAQQQNVYAGKIYKSEDVKIKPNFEQGGDKGFYTYLMRNFRVPETDKDYDVVINVSFIVETDGTLSDIKIVKDPGHGLGAEAVRVISTCPGKWDPAVVDGEKVRCEYFCPIKMKIKS